MKKLIEPVIAVCVLIGMIVGGMAYFAKADDLKLVETRLEQKITNDQIMQLSSRAWQLEDRNNGAPLNQWRNAADRAEYRALKMKIEALKRRQEKLIKSQ